MMVPPTGKWQNTGGEKSKFGLSTADILELVHRLRAENALDSLQLLHFHRIPRQRLLQTHGARGITEYINRVRVTDQIFPILPIQRLNEEPTRRARLEDITRFTTFEAPHEVIAPHDGVFKPISELRRLPMTELTLLRQVFDLVMGG